MANLNDAFLIGKLIGSLLLIKRVTRVEGMFEVKCCGTHLLFHVSHILKDILVNGNFVFLQLVYQFIGNILSSNVNFVNCMRHRITFKNRNSIADTFPALYYHTCRLAC